MQVQTELLLQGMQQLKKSTDLKLNYQVQVEQVIEIILLTAINNLLQENQKNVHPYYHLENGYIY